MRFGNYENYFSYYINVFFKSSCRWLRFRVAAVKRQRKVTPHSIYHFDNQAVNYAALDIDTSGSGIFSTSVNRNISDLQAQQERTLN